MMTPERHRGFSLIELLMSIMILGIGIIGIAAMFPGGLALQRRSVDDIVGPLVAKNALATIRAKLQQADFGTLEEYYIFRASSCETSSGFDAAHEWDLPGDWPWMRPTLLQTYKSDDGPFGWRNNGTVDIFNALEFADEVTKQEARTEADENPGDYLYSTKYDVAIGIPYNTDGALCFKGFSQGIVRVPDPPLVLLTQEERSWPTARAPGEPAEYFWECMFRRHRGRVEVAIFVFRLKGAKTTATNFSNRLVRTDPEDDGSLVMGFPMKVDLGSHGTFGPWEVGEGGPVDPLNPSQEAPVAGASRGARLEPGKPEFLWQRQGQVILDNQGLVHEVLVGRSREDDSRNHVQFKEAMPALPGSSLERLVSPSLVNDVGFFDEGLLVDRIWYIPTEVRDEEGTTWEITPLLILVEEL